MRRDYAAAFKFFSLASQSGNVLAIFNLAQMRATGTGIGRDCRQAVEVRYFAFTFYVLEIGIKVVLRVSALQNRRGTRSLV